MSISSIMSSGMLTLQSSMNRANSASSGLNVENGDFAARMVAMRQAEIEAKAAADAIRVGDEVLGALIDIRG